MNLNKIDSLRIYRNDSEIMVEIDDIPVYFYQKKDGNLTEADILLTRIIIREVLKKVIDNEKSN